MADFTLSKDQKKREYGISQQHIWCTHFGWKCKWWVLTNLATELVGFTFVSGTEGLPPSELLR